MRRRPTQFLFALCLLLPLTACGGGGGGSDEPSGPSVLDGFSGALSQPGYDLGRIVEQEPNDSAAQPFRLAPIWPRCSVEVAGHLGTGTWFGAVDPTDVLLFSCTAAQDIALELTFEAVDPASPTMANDVRAEVVRRATGDTLAITAAGGQPRTLTFEAIAGEDYEVSIRAAVAGHGWWVARFTGTDRPAAPPLTSKSTGAGTANPVAAAPPSTPIPSAQRCAHDHVLVRLRDGCTADGVCSRHSMRSGRVTGSGTHLLHVTGAAATDPEARIASVCSALASDPDVLWAEPDWVVRSLGEPGDPEWSRQWNMRAVGATSAWDVTKGVDSVVVGIIDSGIGASPDLAGRLAEGYDFVSSAGIAGDGDGRDPDPTDEGDRFAADGTSSWHGTHIAGLLAANHDDDYGVAGMAPGCKLMILRALGVGGGFVSDAADAILFAAGQLTLPDGRRLATPLRVVNLSVGLDQDSTELRTACTGAANLGVLLVAAVGNNGGAVQYPARYASTLGVAAVDASLSVTAYSSFGSSVDLAAPGGGAGTDSNNDGWHDGVLAPVLDETQDPAAWSHAYLVGTSQAAPHVSGAAALLLSLDPTLSRQDLRTILTGTAFDLGPAGTDTAYGAGLLQVHEAIKIVMGRVGNPRGDTPYLVLSKRSLQFDGFRSLIDVPLMNGGGGTLQILNTDAAVDGGGPNWLSATLLPSIVLNGPVNNVGARVEVDRSLLPATPGRYSGTLTLQGVGRVLGSIRIVAYVGERTRMGRILPMVAIEDGTGIALRKSSVFPEFGYRYWIRGLPTSQYRLMAGEDLNANGFFCEAFEACGWHGGPTEGDADIVPFVAGAPALRGLNITLFPPP